MIFETSNHPEAMPVHTFTLRGVEVLPIRGCQFNLSSWMDGNQAMAMAFPYSRFGGATAGANEEACSSSWNNGQGNNGQARTRPASYPLSHIISDDHGTTRRRSGRRSGRSGHSLSLQ
jgi:hypothetical protein